MNQRYFFIILTFILFFNVDVSPVMAQRKTKSILRPLSLLKKERNKKTTKEELALLRPAEPDRVLSRCKPDNHLKPIRKPQIISISVDGQVHGYDMSHYQGDIEWSTVAKDPLAGFIYLKATEGVGLVDNKYAYNLEEARKMGLRVGSYHFFRAQLPAQEQFDNFMNTIDVKKQDLIPIVDVEILPRSVPQSLFIERLQAFCDLLEKAFGCKPMIYTGKSFYDRHLSNTEISSKNYKFMIAAYMTAEPNLVNGDDYLIWQFTSSGRVDGIRGRVDISRFRGEHQIREILY